MNENRDVLTADEAKKAKAQYDGVMRSLTHQATDVPSTHAIESLRSAARAYADILLTKTKGNRERALAVTKLEESLMWGIKGIVLDPPGTVVYDAPKA